MVIKKKSQAIVDTTQKIVRSIKVKKSIKKSKITILPDTDMSATQQNIKVSQKKVRADDENLVNKIISKIHKNIPTQFDVHRSIQPIYSGGKIQFVKCENKQTKIFSTYDYSIRISQIDQGVHQTIDRINHRDEELANFVVSNDGNKIVTFTKNYLLRYCSLENPLKIQWTQKIEPIFPIDMAMSPEDIFVALGSTNGQIRIINVKKGITSNEYRFHQGSVLKVAWSPVIRKLQLVSAGDDQKIIIFDVVSNTCLCQINGHDSRITSLNFISNGASILSTSSDQHAKIWDLVSFSLKSEVKIDMDIEAGCQFMIMKQEFYIVGSLDGKIYVSSAVQKQQAQMQSFDLFEGQEILKLSQPDPDQPDLYVVTSELHIYIVSVALEKNQFSMVIDQCILGYNDEVLDVRFEQRQNNWNNYFSFDNEYAILATNSPFLKLIKLSNMRTRAWKAHEDIIMTVQFMNKHIISGAKDNLIKLWRVTPSDKIPYQLLSTFQGHSDNIIGVQFSNKDMAFIASVSSDLTLKLWDSYKIINTPEIDSTSLVTQSLRSANAHEKDINCVRFSQNSKQIATSSQDRLIKLWNSDTLMLTMTLKGHKRGVWDVQFSPVDQQLASASGDCTIKVWNLQDGSILHNLEHNASVLRLNWLCFGLILLSGDANGIIKLWNPKKQICTKSFEQHDGKLWALDVSPYTEDGKVYLASGGNDSIFHIWKDNTQEENLVKQEKAHEKQLKLQKYQNLIREGKWKEAALLAFESNFTSHFISAVTELIKNQENQSDLIELAKQLFQEHTLKFMNLINILNTSKKTCTISQQLFNIALREIYIVGLIQKLDKEIQGKLSQLMIQFRSSTLRIQTKLKSMKKQTQIVDFLLGKQNIF